jgi:hypothetical protein
MNLDLLRLHTFRCSNPVINNSVFFTRAEAAVPKFKHCLHAPCVKSVLPSEVAREEGCALVKRKVTLLVNKLSSFLDTECLLRHLQQPPLESILSQSILSYSDF